MATNPLRSYVASLAGASNSSIAELDSQNNILGKIEACLFRTFIATDKDVLKVPFNIGESGSSDKYVLRILEGHQRKQDDGWR